jgi:protein Mpv17
MMVTNAVLGGVADTVAQSITAVRERALRKNPGRPLDPKDDAIAVEIHELDRKNPFNEQDLIPDSKLLPPPFDFERLTRFMAYGFCMAPLQFKWFQFLSRAFPITKTSAFMPAMKRVAFDQLIFAPFGLACFFTAMTVAEGGGRRAVQQKLRDMYVPTLKANFLLWPAVQVVNFRLMPVQFQLVGFILPLPKRPSANSVTALCFNSRYCLDCLPLPYECRRGCPASKVYTEFSAYSSCLNRVRSVGVVTDCLS